MKALVVDNGSTFVKELISLLQKVDVETSLVSRDSFKRGQESEYDFLVLSGGHLANTNVMENLHLYDEEIATIERSDKPILGICLGHQLIASVFGGEIQRADDKIRGVFPIAKVLEHPVLDSVGNLNVFEAHQYSVKKIRPPLISIAESKTGIEILGVDGRKIIGFQFHPEMNQAEDGGRQLVKNFIKIYT